MRGVEIQLIVDGPAAAVRCIARAATLPLAPPFSAIRNASPFVHCALIVPVAVSAPWITPVEPNATLVALMKQSLTTVALAVNANVPNDDCDAHGSGASV